MIRIDTSFANAIKVGNDYYPLNGYLTASVYLTTGVTITERTLNRVIAKGIPFADYVDASTGLPLGATQAATITALQTAFNAVGDSGLDVENLDDVTLTSLSNGQILAYNASLGQWVNVDKPADPAVEDNGGTPVLASGITQAEMQTVLDVDPAGTDNSTDVSIGATATDVLKMAAGQSLGAFDAGSDKLVFWDDSDSKLTYATIGTNLTMTGRTLSAAGGSGGGVSSVNTLTGALTLAAGSNVTITDNGTDTITIAASGGGGGGGAGGGNFMITGFTTTATQQWYGLYLPYANSVRTSGSWQHYMRYHMPADGNIDNVSVHVQGAAQINFGVSINPGQKVPNDIQTGSYDYTWNVPYTTSDYTEAHAPTGWSFSAGDEIGFAFYNVNGGTPFYVTFNVCFSFI